jgi:hypothetical protein
MKISHDGTTVSFKTEPEELFEAEKSGAKSNTVRILDASEADQIKCPPKKILIQCGQEIFLRSLTHICIAGELLGKAIVIFSWQENEKHNPFKHIPGIDEESNSTHTPAEDGPSEPSPLDDAFAAVTVSKNLRGLLQSIAHGRSINSVIQELYEASQYQQFKAETAPAIEEAEQDKKLALIGVSKGLSNILVKLAYNRSMDAVIRELYQAYITKHAEGTT